MNATEAKQLSSQFLDIYREKKERALEKFFKDLKEKVIPNAAKYGEVHSSQSLPSVLSDCESRVKFEQLGYKVHKSESDVKIYWYISW